MRSEFQSTRAYHVPQVVEFIRKELAYIFTFNLIPALCNSDNTVGARAICLSATHEKLIMSSTYTKTNCYLTGHRMKFMICWEVPSALESTDCMGRIGIVRVVI